LRSLGLSYFTFKIKKTLEIDKKKIAVRVHSPPISRKITINGKEHTYKEFLLALVDNLSKTIKDEEKKELYLVYLEEIKDKTNNEILNEIVNYVHELCRFVLETNPKYILSDNFEISIRVLDLTEQQAAAICHSDLCTSNSSYLSINVTYLLRLAALNYDFFQKYYHVENIYFGDAAITLSHELAHAKDFYEINFRNNQLSQLQNEMNINHILPETIKIFNFLSLSRVEAISQIHEVFTAGDKETKNARPAYFIYQIYSSSAFSGGKLNELINETQKTIELLKEVKIDNKDFNKVTGIRYPLGKHCAFMIFLYFYFNSKQEKILTFGKDSEKMIKEVEKYITDLSDKYKKPYSEVRKEFVYNPKRFRSFLLERNFHLLGKSEVEKCLINDIRFDIYLPDFNFATQFLTAIKNMDFVRFFEYYEKACRYFDIPKEKTIFAIKELKETQKFAEQLHREAVKEAWFKH
ncbi:MAG: hypothetical protein AABX39_01065, partial [Nanoarchaeota archaeon]